MRMMDLFQLKMQIKNILFALQRQDTELDDVFFIKTDLCSCTCGTDRDQTALILIRTSIPLLCSDPCTELLNELLLDFFFHMPALWKKYSIETKKISVIAHKYFLFF